MIPDGIAQRLEDDAWAEQDWKDRMDDAIREERWLEFTSELETARQLWTWQEIAQRIADAMGSDLPVTPISAAFMGACRELANVEGWPTVLAALSEAMKAEQLHADEIERRR